MSKQHLVKLKPFAPITLGAFVLTETGVEITGRPTWENYQGAFEFAKRAHRSSGFWLADLLRHGESRKDWAKLIDHAVDATGLSAKTLRNVRVVGAIPMARRRDTVEFSHHVEVAPLTAEEQDHFLERCEDEGWSVRDLRDAIKQSKRETVLEGQADEIWTIEVSVQLEVEGANEVNCEDYAWELVKGAIGTIPSARVVASNARPK
jgi:hypothetical protein